MGGTLLIGGENVSLETCKCGTEVEGDIPKGYLEVFICDNCGRYWDENGEVAEEGDTTKQ